MPAMIKKLSANSQGKDYVVGDLHGCFSMLERLLQHVYFEPTRDRVFSVGDLIDRGPDSLRCLQLLAEPWFYAVQGNHEVMMLKFFQDYLTHGVLEDLVDHHQTGFLRYGGAWIEAYFRIDQQCMTDKFNHGLDLVSQLPLMLVVGNGPDRFHIVHAELVSFNELDAELTIWLDDDIDRWLTLGKIPESVTECLLWGRSLMMRHYGQLSHIQAQTGLSPVFCGHSYAPEPRQVLSHVCVDTGAFKSFESADAHYNLTLFDIKDAIGYSATYEKG